jgi:hypothetical protein
VLVVVIAVRSVPVPVMHVVDVALMLNSLVPAAWSVRVLMLGVGQVRQWVLVVVALVRSVGVSLVHVVHVTLALHARVPAARSVLVIAVHVFRVVVVLGPTHGSSPLC